MSGRRKLSLGSLSIRTGEKLTSTAAGGQGTRGCLVGASATCLLRCMQSAGLRVLEVEVFCAPLIPTPWSSLVRGSWVPPCEGQTGESLDQRTSTSQPEEGAGPHQLQGVRNSLPLILRLPSGRNGPACFYLDHPFKTLTAFGQTSCPP